MIIGVGVDIVDINSFTESFNESKRIRQRVFTETEIAYCESKPNKYQHYAARFAAKEAVMKAIGTGWDKGVQWKQIEVINEENQKLKIKKQNANNQQLITSGGKPKITLSGKALKLKEECGVDKILVSLSHSETQAIAFVVLENKK
jgi:holo-[acyl-carrier protein] synthase